MCSQKEYGSARVYCRHWLLEIRRAPEQERVAWALGELILIGVDVGVKFAEIGFPSRPPSILSYLLASLSSYRSQSS